MLAVRGVSSLNKRWGRESRVFSTGGFILVSDYVRMEVTLIGASWDVVAVCTLTLETRGRARIKYIESKSESPGLRRSFPEMLALP